jgi:hypothetical protein
MPLRSLFFHPSFLLFPAKKDMGNLPLILLYPPDLLNFCRKDRKSEKILLVFGHKVKKAGIFKLTRKIMQYRQNN